MVGVHTPHGPALGLVELCSIARGIRACDAMIKRASVRLVHAKPTHPGKYAILIRGGVQEVTEAMAAGCELAADALVDQMLLPNPHSQLDSVLLGPIETELKAVGVLETYSIASVIRGADAALKAAQVYARRIRLADNIGGKGYFILTGELHDVEEAVKAGVRAIGHGLVAGQEIIANPHPELVDGLG